MMQTTEDSCPIICNVQISVICLSSSTYVTGLDSCQSDVAKAGVHKNVFAVLNVGLASGFTGLNRFYYISLTRKFRVKLSWNPRRTRKFRARGKTEALHVLGINLLACRTLLFFVISGCEFKGLHYEEGSQFSHPENMCQHCHCTVRYWIVPFLL